MLPKALPAPARFTGKPETIPLSLKVRLSETTSSASLEVYADEIYRILDTVRVETIKGMPKVRLLPGETSRDFVLDHKTEQAYLKACPPLLHDVAVVLLDSALRLGEALALQWNDVHLRPAGNARYGWIQVRDEKSKNARRTVPLALRVSHLLATKQKKGNLCGCFQAILLTVRSWVHPWHICTQRSAALATERIGPILFPRTSCFTRFGIPA